MNDWNWERRGRARRRFGEEPLWEALWRVDYPASDSEQDRPRRMDASDLRVDLSTGRVHSKAQRDRAERDRLRRMFWRDQKGIR